MSEALAMAPDELYCLNCSKKLKDKHKFCPSCGQSTRLKRFQVNEIWDMTFKKLIHLDASFIHLLKGLVLNPGEMIRSFLAGKRKKVFSPIKFLFYTAGISLFVSEYFHLFDLMPGGDNPVSQIASRYNNLLVLLEVPVAALLSWAFFRKSSYNYAEHLVYNAFMAGAKTFFFALILTPWLVLAPAQYNTASLIYLVCWLAYYSWATIGLMGGPWWLTSLKVIAIYFLSQIALILSVVLFLMIRTKIAA